MAGYGRSSAPADAALYTPLQTAATSSACLSAEVPSAVLVGHDWGRRTPGTRDDAARPVHRRVLPERALRTAWRCQYLRTYAEFGHQNDFYMFEQSRPDPTDLG